MAGPELEMLRALSALRNPVLTRLFVTLSALGSLTVVFIFVVGLWAAGIRRLGRLAAGGASMAAAVAYSVKFLVRRPRPAIEVPIDAAPLTPSFPSTHAALAFALAYVFSEEVGGSWFFYTVAFLVVISRLYLGAHYPSDVVVGAGIGLLSGAIVLSVRKRVSDKG